MMNWGPDPGAKSGHETQRKVWAPTVGAHPFRSILWPLFGFSLGGVEKQGTFQPILDHANDYDVVVFSFRSYTDDISETYPDHQIKTLLASHKLLFFQTNSYRQLTLAPYPFADQKRIYRQQVTLHDNPVSPPLLLKIADTNFAKIRDERLECN